MPSPKGIAADTKLTAIKAALANLSGSGLHAPIAVNNGRAGARAARNFFVYAGGKNLGLQRITADIAL